MRHLLDLNDLLEEELGQIYKAETKLLNFLVEIAQKTKSSPLLDWIKIYKTIVEHHSEMVRKIFYQLFLPIEPCKSLIIENIIDEYTSAVNRTMDEDIQEEELILALLHIIHYKIASYSILYVHTKALKYWDETIALHIAQKEEKEMESNLTFLVEKHHVFLSDWYSF